MARKLLIAVFSMFILGPSKPDAVVQGILCHSYYQSVGKLTGNWTVSNPKSSEAYMEIGNQPLTFSSAICWVVQNAQSVSSSIKFK
jgi:hypothetical protein